MHMSDAREKKNCREDKVVFDLGQKIEIPFVCGVCVFFVLAEFEWKSV